MNIEMVMDTVYHHRSFLFLDVITSIAVYDLYVFLVFFFPTTS